MSPRGFDRYMVVVGAGRNRKFVGFSHAEVRAHFLGVLSIAAQAPVRGSLMVGEREATAAEIANESGVTRRQAETALAKLKEVHVLGFDEELGAWVVHDWEEVNPAPRLDRTGADRQARFRDRRNGVSNGTRNASKPLRNGREVKKEKKEGAKAPSPTGAERAGKELAKASPEDRSNCRLFAELVRQRNPKSRVPDRGTSAHDGWLRDMRLLRERDGNAVEEIAAVIRWMFTDPGRDAVFWGTTIQAPSGLRAHYPQVWAKMHAQATGQTSAAVESSTEFLARRGAE